MIRKRVSMRIQDTANKGKYGNRDKGTMAKDTTGGQAARHQTRDFLNPRFLSQKGRTSVRKYAYLCITTSVLEQVVIINVSMYSFWIGISDHI